MTKATPQILAEAEIGTLYLELETHEIRAQDTKRRINEAKQKLAGILNERRDSSKLHNGQDGNG